jgi:tRNA(Ile)-lysidine synthase
MPADESLLSTFRQTLERHSPAPRYWIAYSGGLDSRVLLQLCAELKQQNAAFEFASVHVHHGLQTAADTWALRCRESSEALGIPFRLIHTDAKAKPGESPEEAARDARYRALRSILSEGEAILTAQHRNDQAETVLLQLIRGAGIAGLAAMPEFAPLVPGFLLRPLLAYSRDELQNYAEEHGLTWIEDPSNLDLSYDRNFLRHRVMPLLEQRWPAVTRTLARSARHCAEAQETLNSLARDLLESVLNPERNTLNLNRLRHCSATDRRLVLREWLRTNGLRMVSSHALARIQQEMLEAAPDKNPVVRWSEGEIRRFRGELYLLPPPCPIDTKIILPWDGVSVLDLPDANGKLRAVLENGPGIAYTRWQSGKITVCYRQGGEACRLPGRHGSHDLKKLFQEKGIPPWIRERTPLICINDDLAAVAGLWVCELFAAKTGEPAVRIDWQAPTSCVGRAGIPCPTASGSKPPSRRA